MYLDPSNEASGTSNVLDSDMDTSTGMDTLIQSLQDQSEYLPMELQRRGGNPTLKSAAARTT